MSTYIIEVCVESLDAAIQAQSQGADRVELCSRLDLDGLTPSDALIRSVVASLTIPVNVMIRPRGGGFLYTPEEIDRMASAIAFCKTLPVNGVVFGVLKADNELDLQAISKLAKMAEPLDVTIHKAVDFVADPVKAVEDLKQISSVTGMLTSGKADTALKGVAMLKKMIEAAGNSLTIIAAGKITDANLPTVHKMIGANAYHGKKITGNLNY